jgi:hypothetical protein
LRVSRLELTNFSGAGDEYEASLRVSFEENRLVRSIQSVNIRTKLHTNPTTPLSAKAIVDCGSIGGGGGGGSVNLQTFTNNCNNQSSCQATCPTGTKLVSGGCSVNNGGIPIQESYPASDTTWHCQPQSNANTTVYAICTTL